MTLHFSKVNNKLFLVTECTTDKETLSAIDQILREYGYITPSTIFWTDHNFKKRIYQMSSH